MANRAAAAKPWYMDKKFDRFWEHYRSCYAWMNMHQQSMDEATSENPAEMWRKWSEYATQMYHYHRNQTNPGVHVSHPNYPNVNTMYQPSNSSPTKRKNPSQPSSRHNRRAKKRRDRKRVDSIATSQSEMDAMDVDEDSVNQDEEEEDFMCEIAFSDDLMKFLTQSAKHRKQRDAQKKLAEEKEKENAHGEDFDRSYLATTEAPTERPGQRRTAEMKLLYGKGAAMIHGMETAMQLTFDRNCDLKQPKHWPNLPLKIQFN